MFGFIWAGREHRRPGRPLGRALSCRAARRGQPAVAVRGPAAAVAGLHGAGHPLAAPARGGAGAARRGTAAPAGAQRGVGGGVFAAFAQVARSPYLLGIAVFVLFMTWVSTFLYLEQAAFVAKVFHNTDDRTRFLSGVDFWVQLASLLLQALLFSRLLQVVRHARAAGRGAADHGGRLCAVCAGADVRGADRGVCRAARRRLRHHAAVPRLAVHRGQPRGEVPGQEPHRHLCLPRWRCPQRLALQGTHRRPGCRSCGDRLAGCRGCGGLGRAGARPGARLPAARGGARAN